MRRPTLQIVAILSILATGITASRAAPPVPPEEWDDYIEYARLAQAAYRDSDEVLGLAGRAPFRRIGGGETDSGLNWSLYQRLDTDGRIETVLAFAGTEFRSHEAEGLDLRDLATDVDQALRTVGPVSRQYADALRISADVARVLDRIESRPLAVVGHSLAGGIVQYVAAKAGFRGVSFSAAALGPTSIAAIDRHVRRAVGRNVTNIAVAGDPVVEVSGRLPDSMHLGVMYRLPAQRPMGLLEPHELETVFEAMHAAQAQQQVQQQQTMRSPALPGTGPVDLMRDLDTMNLDLAITAADPLLHGYGSLAMAFRDGLDLATDHDEWERHRDDAFTRSVTLGLDLASIRLGSRLAGMAAAGLSANLELADTLHKTARSRRLQNETMRLLPITPPRDARLTLRESLGHRGGSFRIGHRDLVAAGDWSFRSHMGSTSFRAVVDYAFDDRRPTRAHRTGTGRVVRTRETRGAPWWNPFDLFEPESVVTTTRRTSRTREQFDGRRIQREIEDGELGGVSMEMNVDAGSFTEIGGGDDR